MTITEASPLKIVTKMEFQGMGDDDPATSSWELKPNGNNTDVKWQFQSNMGNNPLYRWMGLFMDKMVGGEFEKGLANINGLASKGELAAPPVMAPTDSIPAKK
jgi:Polyketide cyclase / dehydrase and lipid transport